VAVLESHGLRVKPLKWNCELRGNVYRADCAFGRYSAFKDFDGWHWLLIGNGAICHSPFASKAEAQADCQRDLRTRIEGEIEPLKATP
jgi:hypothetical protein